MRIKLVHFTSSLKVGGAETVLCELVAGLPEDRFEHAVLYVHDGPYRIRLQEMGVVCQQVAGFFFRYDLFFFWRLYRQLKLLKPDCLHTLLWAANCSGRVIARLLSIPVVSAMHNNREQDGKMRIFFDRLTMRYARAVVAVSEEVAESLLHSPAPVLQQADYLKDLSQEFQAGDVQGANISRELFFLPAKKTTPILVIKNGVNVQAIVEQSMRLKKDRRQFGFAETSIVIGSVGRLEPVKRYDLLLESFAQLREQVTHAQLLLVGSGSQQKALCAQAKALGLSYAIWEQGNCCRRSGFAQCENFFSPTAAGLQRDQFFAHTSVQAQRDQLSLSTVAQDHIYAPAIQFVRDCPAYGYYPLMDIFVQTSDKEGISLALLEAMSNRLSVVVANAGSMHSVITHEHDGLIVPAGDAQRLSKQLLLLAQDSVIRKKFGTNALKKVQKEFSRPAMHAAYADLFARAAAEKAL